MTYENVQFERLSLSVDIGLAEKPMKNEDHSLVDNEQKLYGVFDGLGGLVGAAIASKAASILIQSSMKDHLGVTDPNLLIEALKDSITNANDVIVDKFLGSATTAVVAKLVSNRNGSFLVWASVGDSRLYYKSADSDVVQISEDEGEGHIVYNCLGIQPGYFSGVKQLGIFAIKSGDQFALVTDGITGDYHPDILSNQEFDKALVDADNAQMAAEALIKVSRKIDDKTAIVVRCD